MVSLTANGKNISNQSVFEFTEATKIIALFEFKTFVVTFEQPKNGSLKILDDKTGLEIDAGSEIGYGAYLRVKPAPHFGYKLVSLTANGKDILNETIFELIEPTEFVAKFDRIVPANNYRIKTYSAVCPGSNDGKIEINVSEVLDYTLVIMSDNGYNKTVRITKSNHIEDYLASGVCQLSFTIAGFDNYRQDFEVTIKEPQELSVYKVSATNSRALHSLSGGNRYSVAFNDELLETRDGLVEVPLRRGKNIIHIITDNACQGVFEEVIYSTGLNNDLLLFPNPTTGYFSVIIPGEEDKVLVEIISLNGLPLFKKEMEVALNGLINMNISSYPSGTYLIKVDGKMIHSVVKVIKR